MDIPNVDVIRHWCAWGVTDNCPDEFIEHSLKRVEQFNVWLSQVKSDSYSDGWNDRALIGDGCRES